jgi:hypothetical protein
MYLILFTILAALAVLLVAAFGPARVYRTIVARGRLAVAYLQYRVARKGAASPFLNQLRAEIGEAMRDPHRYGNRRTRRAMDSGLFRHRSRCRPLMRWDALQEKFVSAARRRRQRTDVARERFLQALHRVHLRRFLLGRKTERRAVNSERRRRALLDRAVNAVDALRAMAETAGVHFAGISNVVAGRRYYDRMNQRLLEGDENGNLRLVAEGPLESIVPTQITGLARA